MSPSRPFILRPVATSLLMIGLLLVGAVTYKQLPVSALPQVDYPTIQVLTFYPGAGPSVIVSSVTAPLERQFGQVPGLMLGFRLVPLRHAGPCRGAPVAGDEISRVYLIGLRRCVLASRFRK